MFKENLKIVGDVSIIKTTQSGETEEVNIPNLVVGAGKDFIASRMVGTASGVMSHMAIGTGTTAAAVGQTSLVTEDARVSLSGSNPNNNTVTYTASFPAGTGEGAITEAGIFNNTTTGSMLCRTTFPVVNKLAGDSIAITWVITIV